MQHTIRHLLWIAVVAAVVGIVVVAVAGPVQVALSSPASGPALAPAAQAGDNTTQFGFGRTPTDEEIAAWDIDVEADGTGLPAGSGTAVEGAAVYAAACAECHGETGVEGPGPVLVAPYDPDNWPGEVRAIGNYWPYATTVYDYTNRAMPFDAPKTLSADEVYAVTAWMLHQNGIIAEDEAMDAKSLPQVEMPALEKWIPRDLRETYPFR